VKVELRLLDPRLPGWGFPSHGSALAAGLDLHACIAAPLVLMPQAPPVLISAGIALRIGDPEWCALILPRSGLGHAHGLVLGNTVGVIDADYEGPCLISAWNRNPRSGAALSGIVIRPGDRIAQLVLTRIARPEIAVVEAFSHRGPPGSTQGGTLAGTEGARGDRGFGSTGTSGASAALADDACRGRPAR
jgi:dUTP pyrophosphatase